MALVVFVLFHKIYRKLNDKRNEKTNMLGPNKSELDQKNVDE